MKSNPLSVKKYGCSVESGRCEPASSRRANSQIDSSKAAIFPIHIKAP